MNDTNEQILYAKKAEHYFNKKQMVHIDTITDKFYNGEIIKCYADFLILKDRYIGEVPIYYSEISTIEPYKKEGFI